MTLSLLLHDRKYLCKIVITMLHLPVMIDTRGSLVSMGIRDRSRFSCQKLPSVSGLIRQHHDAAFSVILCPWCVNSVTRRPMHASCQLEKKGDISTVPLEHLAGLDPCV